MRVLKLTVENIMRVSAVEITPQGNVVVIGGRNAQGKSSVLSAIVMALGGKGESVAQPVRHGEERGRIVVDLGEIVVERVFRAAGGTTLAVRAASGAVFPSPQAMLNALVGKLAFDPLEFARADAKSQADTLRALAGIDTAALEVERATHFAQRTETAREVDRLAKVLLSMPSPPPGVEVPEVEPDISSLLVQAAQLEHRNGERRAVAAAGNLARSSQQHAHQALIQAEETVKKMEAGLRQAQAVLAQRQTALEAAAEAVRRADEATATAQAAMEDPAPLTARVGAWQETARLCREAKAKREIEEQWLDKQKFAADLTRAILAVDEKKRQAVAAAKFPVVGLSIGEAGVTFNGVPFQQASSAEQLRASVAIGLALNPKLKVMIVRDGSLLDEDGLLLLADLANEHDAQVWVERVGKGAECSFVIEDGALEPEAFCPRCHGDLIEGACPPCEAVGAPQ